MNGIVVLGDSIVMWRLGTRVRQMTLVKVVVADYVREEKIQEVAKMTALSCVVGGFGAIGGMSCGGVDVRLRQIRGDMSVSHRRGMALAVASTLRMEAGDAGDQMLISARRAYQWVVMRIQREAMKDPLVMIRMAA